MPSPDHIPYGHLTLKWAAIADKFALTPAQIGDMTDYQIDALLYHPRDKDGGLVAPALDGPPPAPTPETRLASIAQLEALRLITPERAAEMREEVARGKIEG